MSRLPITREIRVAPDYSAMVFEDVDLNLFELHTANHGATLGMTMGRTFRGCRIQGPAIMLVSTGVHFNDCNFGSPDGVMANLILRPAGTRALGTLPFRNTLFDGCEFYNVGFTGSEALLNDLLNVGKTAGDE